MCFNKRSAKTFKNDKQPFDSIEISNEIDILQEAIIATTHKIASLLSFINKAANQLLFGIHSDWQSSKYIMLSRQKMLQHRKIH